MVAAVHEDDMNCSIALEVSHNSHFIPQYLFFMLQEFMASKAEAEDTVAELIEEVVEVNNILFDI